MWETWDCPKCKHVNVIDMGILEDAFEMIPEACQCYNCEHIDWLCTITKEQSFYTLENAGIEEGQPACSHCNGTGIKKCKT